MNRQEIMLKNQLVTMLWAAFMIATIAYGVIIFFLNKGQIDNFQFNRITLTLSVIGLFNIIIGHLISSKIKNLLQKSQTKTPDQGLEALYSKFITLNIIAWAMIESAAALGLVCSFLEKNGIYFLSLGLPALIVLFLSKPKPSILKEIMLRN